MRKLRHFSLIVLAAFLLGACAKSSEPTATQAPSPTAQRPTATDAPVAPTATNAPTAAPTLPPPTAAIEPSPAPTVTPLASFLDVRPDDWVRGPASAQVTIVEYSDFQ